MFPDPPLLLLAAALAALVVLLVRYRRERRHARPAAEDLSDLPEVPILRVEDPTDTDVRAYDLIKEYRDGILWKVSLTDLNPQVVYEQALRLIREVGRVYHPDSERPEYRVSIQDLVDLNRRINERIDALLSTFPYNRLKDVSVDTVIRYRDAYLRVTRHPAFGFLRRHDYLYRVVREVWATYNYSNPWYWGRRAVFTVGQEAVVRRLLVTIVTIVGEESVRLFGRRKLTV